MIEKFMTAGGRQVFRRNGILLASAYDPVAEAKQWVDRRRTFLTEVKTVVVLGAGCGFHIDELSRQTVARVLVIDSSAELIAAARQNFNFSAPKVIFENLVQASDLRHNEIIRSALKGSFVVLRHTPTTIGDREFFDDCERQLIARDWGALNWQWQLKGHAPLDSQPKIGESQSSLTIYDLAETELVLNSEERDRMIVKALRELVK